MKTHGGTLSNGKTQGLWSQERVHEENDMTSEYVYQATEKSHLTLPTHTLMKSKIFIRVGAKTHNLNGPRPCVWPYTKYLSV